MVMVCLDHALRDCQLAVNVSELTMIYANVSHCVLGVCVLVFSNLFATDIYLWLVYEFTTSVLVMIYVCLVYGSPFVMILCYND